MIVKFQHKGLKKLFEKDDRRVVSPVYADKISRILARLDCSTCPEDMDLPGYRLHPLRGDLADFWSVTVSANWRVIFKFENGHATDVDLIDYH